MDGSAAQVQAPGDSPPATPETPDLTAEQRDLLASLERSMQQAARGEGRPFEELLEELRLEHEVVES